MDDMPRGELFELYGMLLAGVSAVRRMLERVADGPRPVDGGAPGPARPGRGGPPGDDPPGRDRPDGAAVAVAGATDRSEVVASVERMRQAMLEALFVLDFVVVHRRLDTLMVRRVRTAVVGGIDSADACLAEEAAGG